MSSRGSRRALLNVLARQVRSETIPWAQGLVRPWVQGRPAPLQDTVDPAQLADVDSKFVMVDGVRLHYKERGPTAPGTPAVLLLHGMNGSTFSWRHQMEALAAIEAVPDGCRVVAFDRPPYGLSGRPMQWEGGDQASPYTSEAGARFTEGLCRALGITEAVVVGHSAGALTAMELFKRAPQLIKALVFVAPALPSNAKQGGFAWKASLGQQLQRLYMQAVLQNDDAGVNYIRTSIRKRSAEVAAGKLNIGLDDQRTTQEVINGYLKPMQAHDWDRASLYSFRAFSFAGAMPYEQVTQPVLFICGERDVGLTAGARKVADIMRRRTTGSTELVELQGCGHVPMDEQPERFMQELQPFCERVLCRQEGSDQQPSQTSVQAGLLEGPAGSLSLPSLAPVADSVPLSH